MDELQASLDAAKTSLAKAVQESQEAQGETDAMSAQIQQLTAAKEDIKKQVDELKSASSAVAAPPTPNPMAGMAGIMKAQLASQKEPKILLLKSRLHLTREQEAAVKAAMDDKSKRMEEVASRMFSGWKIDPQAMADLANTNQSRKCSMTS